MPLLIQEDLPTVDSPISPRVLKELANSDGDPIVRTGRTVVVRTAQAMQGLIYHGKKDFFFEYRSVRSSACPLKSEHEEAPYVAALADAFDGTGIFPVLAADIVTQGHVAKGKFKPRDGYGRKVDLGPGEFGHDGLLVGLIDEGQRFDWAFVDEHGDLVAHPGYPESFVPVRGVPEARQAVKKLVRRFLKEEERELRATCEGLYEGIAELLQRHVRKKAAADRFSTFAAKIR